MKFNMVLSALTKDAIFSCYSLIKYYLHDEEVESEERLAMLYGEIGIYRLVIPPKIYEMIVTYVDEHIAPIVYDFENTFCQSNHLDELYAIVDNNPESPLADAGYREHCNFIMTLYDIEIAFDEFAMENLHPLLIT